MTTTIEAHLRFDGLYCNNLSKTTVGKESCKFDFRHFADRAHKTLPLDSGH